MTQMMSLFFDKANVFFIATGRLVMLGCSGNGLQMKTGLAIAQIYEGLDAH